MRDVEARVLDAIDDADTVNLLAEAVRIPSVTGTDAESDLQHRFARLLTEADLDVDVWKLDLDDLRARDGFPGTEAPRAEGYGVVGTTSGEGPPALILQGHADVVPTGDLAKWAGSDPFAARITGDTLHGRGACDMKAGVAVNLAVVRALHRSGVRLARPLAVHCVVSEEDGGLGAFATLARGHTGEAAVITEP
ncbi:M20/M25/M40 family metallo-hydrolase, partial [Nonomuraea sp. NPDC055795]